MGSQPSAPLGAPARPAATNVVATSLVGIGTVPMRLLSQWRKSANSIQAATPADAVSPNAPHVAL